MLTRNEVGSCTIRAKIHFIDRITAYNKACKTVIITVRILLLLINPLYPPCVGAFSVNRPSKLVKEIALMMVVIAALQLSAALLRWRCSYQLFYFKFPYIGTVPRFWIRCCKRKEKNSLYKL